MRYLKNYIAQFNQCYYKIGHSETDPVMFYDELSYPVNSIISGKCIALLEKVDALVKKMH